MHVLLMIISVLGALGFWWYRIQAAGRVAGEIVDTAQRARGAVKRKRFRTKAELSPLSAIDDPIVGAATIIWAIADDCGASGPTLVNELEEALCAVASREQAQEAAIYGQWAVRQVAEPSVALKRVGPLLVETLTEAEREQFVTMTKDLLGKHSSSEAVLRTNIQTLRRYLKLVSEF